ncbi:MAG: hypothetical protein RLZZ524_3125 [Pseudomonadota bacterium]|jgi:hypothetical protein
MSLFVKFEGLSEVTGTLRRLPKHLETTTINRMSQVAYDEAQRGAGRHVKTGALVQSLFNRAIPNGREVGHDPQRAPHAIFVQLGTKPHEIRPKTKKALRWAAGGKFVFAGKVKHPGYIGDAYLIKAATLAVQEFSAILSQAMKEAP